MGSKNLKAIGVIGTGSVKLEASKTDWKELVHYQHTLLGANSGGVVPNTFQSWQPDGYYGGTRWTAAKGLYWGAAIPPVETGDCTADDLNSIGLRTFKGYADFGPGVGDKHTVKIAGCHACPIRCHIDTDVPALEAFGVSRYQVNTCNGNSSGSGFIDRHHEQIGRQHPGVPGRRRAVRRLRLVERLRVGPGRLQVLCDTC